MTDQPGEWVDKGSYVMPVVDDDRIDPVLLALLHCVTFLEISDDDVVDPDAAVEALEHVGHYLQRLPGPEIERLQRQLDALAARADTEDWPEEARELVATFFEVLGVGEE